MKCGMRAIHPMEVLREEFALADVIDCDLPSDWLLSDQPVTQHVADELARELGTTPEFWLNLQAAYDAAKERR